jgi:hypothetical protein
VLQNVKYVEYNLRNKNVTVCAPRYRSAGLIMNSKTCGYPIEVFGYDRVVDSRFVHLDMTEPTGT